MLTNEHILAINDELGYAKQVLGMMCESSEREEVMCSLSRCLDHLFALHADMSSVQAQIAELSKQLYEPIVAAQEGKTVCLYIDCDALRKGAYTSDEFEKMLCHACESDARSLGAFLKKYGEIGYLDFHGDSKRKIWKTLQEHFPTMRRYSYQNFAAAV